MYKKKKTDDSVYRDARRNVLFNVPKTNTRVIMLMLGHEDETRPEYYNVKSVDLNRSVAVFRNERAS